MPVDDVAARGFDAGAVAYEAARPGYPDEVVAVLAEQLGVGLETRVLDLAAGTGKLTRRLVDLGASVLAVEPVEGMRAQLVSVLPEVEAVDGTAEDIPLPTPSSTSSRWPRPSTGSTPGLPSTEIARVLKPGGAFALLWNEGDETTPWVAEMSRLIRWHERTVSRYQHVDWARIVAEADRFTPLQEHTTPWDQPMTRELLAERVRSISYIAAVPAGERERLAAEVVYLVSRLPEPFALPYTCRLQWAHLR